MKTAMCTLFLSLLCCVLAGDAINTDEILERIQTQWQRVSDYTCTLETYTITEDDKQVSTIEHKFLKPGWIRMQILEGDGKGSIGVYDPFTKKVKGCKTGILKIIVLTMDITDSRVRSIRGHRIDQGDCLSLIERLRAYHSNGEFTSIERTTFDGDDAYLLRAAVQDSSRLWGATIENIWLDAEHYFPLRSEQRLADGTIVHYSMYRDIEVNTGLTEDDFKL